MDGQTVRDLLELNKSPQAAQTYPEHSCYEWNRQGYRSTPEYTSSECGTCGKITGFRWRSRWKRVFSLFSSEPVKYRSEVRYVIEIWWERKKFEWRGAGKRKGE